jgi:hypothetical protein
MRISNARAQTVCVEGKFNYDNVASNCAVKGYVREKAIWLIGEMLLFGRMCSDFKNYCRFFETLSNEWSTHMHGWERKTIKNYGFSFHAEDLQVSELWECASEKEREWEREAPSVWWHSMQMHIISLLSESFYWRLKPSELLLLLSHRILVFMFGLN